MKPFKLSTGITMDGPDGVREYGISVSALEEIFDDLWIDEVITAFSDYTKINLIITDDIYRVLCNSPGKDKVNNWQTELNEVVSIQFEDEDGNLVDSMPEGLEPLEKMVNDVLLNMQPDRIEGDSFLTIGTQYYVASNGPYGLPIDDTMESLGLLETYGTIKIHQQKSALWIELVETGKSYCVHGLTPDNKKIDIWYKKIGSVFALEFIGEKGVTPDDRAAFLQVERTINLAKQVSYANTIREYEKQRDPVDKGLDMHTPIFEL